MPKIVYIDHSGERYELEVPVGKTVMEGAVDNGVPGVDGDCGGQASCATCHVYIDAEYQHLLPAKSEVEEEMLELAVDVRENSRLGCRLAIDERLEGMVVHTPESQF